MAGTLPAGVIDPTKPGEYPVILSDALLGKSNKEIYTGVRYNHKPALTSEAGAPSNAKIKASGASYELSYQENGDKYSYGGARTSKDGQYVLIFDPDRQAFVLHRLDSIFHMNLTRTPANKDAESLRKEFPHLDTSMRVSAGDKRKAADKGRADKAAAGAEVKLATDMKKPAAEKKRPEKKPTQKPKEPISLSLPGDVPPKAMPPPPPPAPAKKEKKKKVESEDESESEDDDGGLVLEFPEGRAPVSSRMRSPPRPAVQIRRFSEFVESDGEADNDAEGEEEDDDEDGRWEEALGEVDDLALPSPVKQQAQPGSSSHYPEPAATPVADDDYDLEAELEKELMNDDESEVSEED